VMPEFKARDEVREAEKRSALAPYIEAALAREPRPATLGSLASKPLGARRPRRSSIPIAAAPTRSRPGILSRYERAGD
jgi:hypothetical protein